MRRTDLRQVLCVALTSVLTVTQLGLAGAQVPSGKVGEVRGSARSLARLPLEKVKMELLDPGGRVTGSAITGADGGFSISMVAYDTYALRCVDQKGRVLGTSSVRVDARTVAVTVTCASEPPPPRWPRKAVLFGLAAAATAVGGVLVVGPPDASPAR